MSEKYKFEEKTGTYFISYTISGYKIDQRCEVIYFQDDDKNHCIAFATELFFEEILEKKNE